MVAVTAALIGFFAFVIMRVTTPQMTTLFTDLSTEDSSAIIKELERQAIPFELRNDGAAIMVPKDKVTRLRMKLAEGGMPKGGGVGYEIFDKSDALGTTSFVQNINHLRALEGELARTIRAIDRVQAARVHLVLPEKPLFSREGANVALVDKGRKAKVLEGGYGDQPHIRQALHAPPRFDASYVIVGSWLVGDQPAGIGLREDRGRITRNTSRFVPHYIV